MLTPAEELGLGGMNLAGRVLSTFVDPQLELHGGWVERALGEHPWFAGESFSAAPASATSSASTRRRLGSWLNAHRACSSRSGSRATPNTSAPSAKNVRAVSKPTPREIPVIRMRRPASDDMRAAS